MMTTQEKPQQISADAKTSVLHHWFTTSRVAPADALTANFTGQSHGGRLESGYVVMREDLVIPRCEKCTLVVEAIGDDKVRVNHQSLPSPLVILADQALEIIAAGKSLHIARAPRSAENIDVEPTGLADAGYGPKTK